MSLHARQQMEQHTLRNVNNCFNTSISSYLETSGGQSSNLYLYIVHFSTLELLRHLWQHKTVVFLHWCLIRALLLVPPSLLTFTAEVKGRNLHSQSIRKGKNFKMNISLLRVL